MLCPLADQPLPHRMVREATTAATRNITGTADTLTLSPLMQPPIDNSGYVSARKGWEHLKDLSCFL